MFEGTDNRENMQKTLTQQIQLLDGLKIKMSYATEVEIKLYCLLGLCAHAQDWKTIWKCNPSKFSPSD